MRNYIVQRILATIPVMGTVVLFVFLLLRLAPCDPAALIAGDYATPEDIANIALFLACDESRMITGAAIPADGGRSAY